MKLGKDDDNIDEIEAKHAIIGVIVLMILAAALCILMPICLGGK